MFRLFYPMKQPIIMYSTVILTEDSYGLHTSRGSVADPDPYLYKNIQIQQIPFKTENTGKSQLRTDILLLYLACMII